MDRKRQLEEQVVQLSRQVDEMRVRLAALEGGSGDRASATTPRSRRDLLKLGGAAALGVAGAVGAAALGTVPAQAADGANLVIGNNNSTTNKAESPTILVDDNATNGFTGFPGGTSPLSGALRVHGGSDAPGGGNPTLAPGDTLNFNGGGQPVSDNGSQLTVSGMQPVGYIEIETLGPENCVVDNGELFRGLMGPSLGKRMSGHVRRGFRAMNEALKARAEEMWRARK